MIFNPYALIPLIAALLVSLLGIIVFLQDHSSKLPRLFIWLCLIAAAWPAFLALTLCQTNPERVVFFMRLGHTAPIFFPSLFFEFVITLIRKERLRWITILLCVEAAIILPLSWFTDWRFPGTVIHYSWGMYATAGPLMTVDALTAAAVILSSCVLLVYTYFKERYSLSHVERNKLRSMMFAMIIFSIAPVDYLPKYGIPIFPFGSICVVLFVIVVAYAIIRYQALNFRLVLRDTIIYSTLVAMVSGIYFSFLLIAERLLQGFIGYRSLVVSLIAGMVITLCFIPVKEFIQSIIDRLFFKKSPAELAEENKRLMGEVSQSEKLKSVAALTAGMAHEIKNPLCAIKTFVEYVPERHNDPEFQEIFSRIVPKEVNRIHALVQRLLDFAKPSPANKRLVRASFLIDETLEFLSAALLEKRIQIIRAYSECDTLYADPIQMKQVFLNLLLNSIDAMEGPGNISVSTIQENAYIEVLVTDTGRGISRKDLARVSEPFYTTKSNGTGLGLSIVRNIIQEHDGCMEIESLEGVGTTIRITLPLVHEQQTNQVCKEAGSEAVQNAGLRVGSITDA